MKKATKNDFDKNKNSLKTFYLHENKRNVADSLKNLILNYKHFENMLILLCHETQNNKQFHILNLLLNKIIMKAVSQKLNGGVKTEKNIKELYDHFENHKLFQQMIDFSKENLNGHNCSMIVERLKKDWKNASENRKKYFKNSKGFTGIPQFPKPKRLDKVQNYSVPLEPGKWAIKNEKIIGINLSKKQIRRKINSDVPYLKDKKIKSITVSLSNGHIYYNFQYVVKNQKNQCSEGKNHIKKTQKEAGLDIGIKNLAAIFVHDSETKSLIVDGKRFVKYNAGFNRKISKLNQKISNEILSKKEHITKNGEVIEIANEYTENGRKLRFFKQNITEERNRFFEDQFNKISKKILIYLKESGVTDLVISKNLSFVKQSGEIKQLRKTKQGFYQIPFGKLLNLLIEKGVKYGIKIKEIDEAYTSKTSSISGDIHEVLRVKSLNKEHKFSTTDLKGSRVKRGLFKDFGTKKVINADLNGSLNHIKVGFKQLKLLDFSENLSKFCNPIKIKSESEFESFLLEIFSNRSRSEKYALS